MKTNKKLSKSDEEQRNTHLPTVPVPHPKEPCVLDYPILTPSLGPQE